MIYEYWLAGIKEITDLKKMEKDRRKKNSVYTVLFKDVSGKTEIYYRSSVCIVCTRTTSG